MSRGYIQRGQSFDKSNIMNDWFAYFVYHQILIILSTTFLFDTKEADNNYCYLIDTEYYSFINLSHFPFTIHEHIWISW